MHSADRGRAILNNGVVASQNRSGASFAAWRAGRRYTFAACMYGAGNGIVRISGIMLIMMASVRDNSDKSRRQTAFRHRNDT
jgi:hypothetical protein